MYISLPALRPLLISTLFAVFTSALSVEYEVTATYDPNCGSNEVGYLAGSWDGIQLHSSKWTSAPRGRCLKFDRALPEGCLVFFQNEGGHIRYFDGPIAKNTRETDLTFEKILITCRVNR
ncbi:hypothetical protein DFH05DRAFT_1460314 [Lentinula detonsa]|uniref:Uncharacterized protein n=1 Tax=Lentinula detonsa TaxID=2804962 RepID=A0A9W8NZZ2_9AGAR|nr:hypothetical protein DFH05DRAFT_1460314 [Lentinula detonsa]